MEKKNGVFMSEAFFGFALINTLIAKLIMIIILFGCPFWKILLAIVVPTAFEFIAANIINKTAGGKEVQNCEFTEEPNVVYKSAHEDDNDSNNCNGECCQHCVCCEQHDRGVQDCTGDESELGGGTDEVGDRS